jgi:hypothetical protein
LGVLLGYPYIKRRRRDIFVENQAPKNPAPLGGGIFGQYTDDVAPERSFKIIFDADTTKMPALWALNLCSYLMPNKSIENGASRRD